MQIICYYQQNKLNRSANGVSKILQNNSLRLRTIVLNEMTSSSTKSNSVVSKDIQTPVVKSEIHSKIFQGKIRETEARGTRKKLTDVADARHGGRAGGRGLLWKGGCARV